MDLGVAFVATVIERSEFGPADWHVELDIGEVYSGDVPDPMVLQVWSAGCTVFRPEGLTAGDRVFFAMEKLSLPANSSLSGPLVIWRQVDDGWAFAEDALWDSFGTLGPNYWSRALRDADTLAEILAVISGLPDTATELPDSTGAESGRAPLGMIAAVVMAFIVAIVRFGSVPALGIRQR